MEYTVRNFSPISRFRKMPTTTHSLLFIVLVFLVALPVLIPPAQGRAPDWTYSSPDSLIGGVTLSSHGDLVSAGAGKVLLFSRPGTLLATSPYGNTVVMTPDGNFTASAYVFTLYFFKNLPSGGRFNRQAVKLWEYELPQQARSLGMSTDGGTLVVQTVGNDIVIINTSTAVAKENTNEGDSTVAISANGRIIIGISPTQLHSYNKDGVITRSSDIKTVSQPHTVLMTSSGSIAMFDDGQAVHSVTTSDGNERWMSNVGGSITSLSMNPSGSTIIAGTGSGSVTALSAKGNLSWTYVATRKNQQPSLITCTALSDNGAVIAAGTADGRVLFLNTRGELADSYEGKEPVRHIAVSADGSTAAASSDYTLVVFAPGSPSRPQTVTTASPSPATTILPPSSPMVPAPVPATTLTSGPATATTPAEIPTTYSVIRTPTRSPASLTTLVGSLVLALFLMSRKQ